MSTPTKAAVVAQHQEVLRRFDTYVLDEDQKRTLVNSRISFQNFAHTILNNTKPGREQSAALTALEEAKYWTNQAIAKDGVPTHPDTTFADVNV